MGHSSEQYCLHMDAEQRDWLLNVLERRRAASEPASGALYSRLLDAWPRDRKVRQADDRERDLPAAQPGWKLNEGTGKLEFRQTVADDGFARPNRTIPGPAREATEAEQREFDALLDKARPAAVRHEVLDRAGQLIGGDRADAYGDAKASFERIGRLWSVLIGKDITATDVARMMVAMKLSRLHHTADHADSWVDIAGYAALGAEIAQVRL